MTFGLSLQNLNIAKTPMLGSGAFQPNGIFSQHPLPWKVPTRDGERIAIEFTSTSGTSNVAIPQVVYRFANF
jgi:hypothetical protein